MSQINAGRIFIIMGVSSTGKSSIGYALAKKMDAKFIDGDDLHPKANILKMSSGQPLNDEDRVPWLERIRDAAFSCFLMTLDCHHHLLRSKTMPTT